ncbi:retrovirus-related pol polyprotein from transposon TNT 1-94 [Tanacetum coccineum]
MLSEAIRIFIAYAAHKNMIVYQMDVKIAFLNAEESSLRAKAGSIGLKEGKDILLVQIYVDDIIFASTDPTLCETFSKIMCLKFKMSMMGKMSFFLGLQISQSPRGIFLNQSKYALEIIKKYGMETSDPLDTPMVKPTKKHLHAVKKIFRYLRGTINMGLWYSKDSCIALTAFADADHAGCQDTRRSTSGSMQLLGDRLVSWSSKKQKSTTISSTEAECIALFGCCAQILWMTTDRLWPWIQQNTFILR